MPTDNSSLGKTAVAAEPFMAQVFIGRNPALEGRRWRSSASFTSSASWRSSEIRYGGKIAGGKWFYVSSLSCTDADLQGHADARAGGEIFPDLRDPAMDTALALVHSRFSAPTRFRAGTAAHPYRYIAHNGEINTLRGNINWMHARAGECSSPTLFGDDIKKILPVINTDGSDSAHVRQLPGTARAWRAARCRTR